MNEKTVTGACACGRVCFELDMPTRFVAHCHCENCRRAHGAGFVTWAGVVREQFRWIGENESLREWNTPTGATRRFCGECGSTLTYEGPRWPDEMHAAVANLDGELDKLPGGHANPDEAPSWCPITDELPR